MRPLVVVAFLLAAVTASAQEGKDAIKTIEQTNQLLKGTPGCSKCPENLPGRDSSPQIDQCLKELCPSGVGQLFREYKRVPSVELNDPKDKQFADFVRQSFSNELRAQLGSLRRIADFLKSGQKITDPQALLLANVGSLLSNANKIVYRDENTIDRAATRKSLPHFSDREVDLMLAIVDKMEFSQTQVATVPFLRESYPLYVQRYSPLEVRQHLSEGLAALEKMVPSIERAWGLPTEALLELKRQGAFDRLRSGNFDRKDIEDLAKDLRTAIFFHLLGNDGPLTQKIKSLPVDIKRSLGPAPEGTLAARMAYIQKFLDGKDVDNGLGLIETQKDVVNTCLNALRSVRAFDPTPEQRTAFLARLPKIQSDFLASLKPYVSQESSGKLGAALAKLKISLPPNYNEYRAALLRHLQDDYAGTTRMFDITRDLYSQKPQLVAAVDIFFQNVDFQNDPNYGGDVREVCEENALRPVGDASSLGLDNLTVGQLSVRDEKWGSSVVMHEFGHQFSRLARRSALSSASTGWFRRVRSCLVQGNQGESFVEEDWADLVESSSGSSVSFCGVMTNNPTTFTLTSEETNESIAHSSSLFRLLNNSLVRGGRIPSACQAALKERGETMNLRNCSNPPQ